MPKESTSTITPKLPPSVKWFVWIRAWEENYYVIIKITNIISCWEIKGNHLEYIENDLAWARSNLTNPIQQDVDFMEISEDEAIKIIIGGVQYGKQKYEHFSKKPVHGF